MLPADIFIDDFRSLVAQDVRVKEIKSTFAGYEVLVRRESQVASFARDHARYRGLPVHVVKYVPSPLTFLGAPVEVGPRLDVRSGMFRLMASRVPVGWEAQLVIGHGVHTLVFTNVGVVEVPERRTAKGIIRAGERLARHYARLINVSAKGI